MDGGAHKLTNGNGGGESRAARALKI